MPGSITDWVGELLRGRPVVAPGFYADRDGGANIYQKKREKVGENFKGKVVILVLHMLSLSNLFSGLVPVQYK